MSTEYPLCPGILNLQTDAIPIPDFQLGPGAECNTSVPESELTVEYVVGETDRVRDTDKGIEVRENRILYHKGLGIFGDLQCVISLNPLTSRLKVNKTYHRLGRKSISTVPSVGRLLEDIVSIQLLRNGYALLYCGGVTRGDAATLLIGLTNTGKTTTVLNLVQNGDAKYISEDIAITDGSNLYCCPFTVSPVDADFTPSRRTAAHKWIAENIPLLDSTTLRSIDSIYDILGEDRIEGSGAISQICFLFRSKDYQTETDDCQRIVLANRGEFTYTTNQILLGAQYLGYDIDIVAAMETERSILNDLVRDSEIHHASGNQEELYRSVKDKI